MVSGEPEKIERLRGKLEDHFERLESRRNRRRDLWEKFERLPARCSNCGHFFYLFKANYFDAGLPFRCPNCGVDDTAENKLKPGASAIELFLTVTGLERWRSGWLAQEKRLPGPGGVEGEVRFPSWIFDAVFPALSRFEQLTLVMLKRFASPENWVGVSQRAIAYHLAQVKPEGNHIPARQNVSKAIKEIYFCQIRYSVNGQIFERPLIRFEWVNGRDRKIKLDWDLPPGARVLVCEKKRAKI